MKKRVISKGKAKVRGLSFGALHPTMEEASKRDNIKGEVRGGQRKGVCRDGFTIIGTLEMSNDRR